MSEPFERRRGKNSGKNRPSREDFEPKHNISSTSRIPDECGVYYECMDGETAKDYLIPRQSLSERLHLAIWPVKLEFESLTPTKRLQIDRKGNPVETTDPRARVAWRSDSTLLRRGKPDNFGEGNGTFFKRLTSNSKRLTTIVEVKTDPPTCVCGCGTQDHLLHPELIGDFAYGRCTTPNCACVRYESGQRIGINTEHEDPLDSI